jgi:hypothetical protein
MYLLDVKAPLSPFPTSSRSIMSIFYLLARAADSSEADAESLIGSSDDIYGSRLRMRETNFRSGLSGTIADIDHILHETVMQLDSPRWL